MTGPLLHGRQTCSLIPVGVELDLTAPTPRHRARRAEDPPTMWTPFGGKHRRPDPAPDGWTLVTDERLASRLRIGPPCPCPCHVSLGITHAVHCCPVWMKS